MVNATENNEVEISTQRLEAFSDGVFAIAITLLILEVKIPGKEALAHSSLKDYLIKIWPTYFAYVFSFIILGIYWANHHYIFKLYKRTDHVFNMLNVLFLMTIAFLPFPSAVLGEFILEEEHRRTATILYSIGIYLPALCWYIIWLYATRGKRLIDQRLKDDFISRLSRQYLLSNGLYLFAILLAFFNPIASICMNVLLTLFYMLPPKRPEYKRS
jgi:uncharacterized membrane protein